MSRSTQLGPRDSIYILAKKEIQFTSVFYEILSRLNVKVELPESSKITKKHIKIS